MSITNHIKDNLTKRETKFLLFSTCLETAANNSELYLPFEVINALNPSQKVGYSPSMSMMTAGNIGRAINYSVPEPEYQIKKDEFGTFFVVGPNGYSPVRPHFIQNVKPFTEELLKNMNVSDIQLSDDPDAAERIAKLYTEIYGEPPQAIEEGVDNLDKSAEIEPEDIGLD